MDIMELGAIGELVGGGRGCRNSGDSPHRPPRSRKGVPEETAQSASRSSSLLADLLVDRLRHVPPHQASRLRYEASRSRARDSISRFTSSRNASKTRVPKGNRKRVLLQLRHRNSIC